MSAEASLSEGISEFALLYFALKVRCQRQRQGPLD
jgi:hypothetical protein